MSEELKPCPCCGAELKVFGPEDWSPSYDDPDSGGYPYNASCDCGYSFSNGSYEYDEFLTAANRRADGWVSATEGFPEDGVRALVYVSAFWGESIHVATHDSHQGKWIAFGGLMSWRDEYVAHWQPFPQHPTA